MEPLTYENYNPTCKKELKRNITQEANGTIPEVYRGKFVISHIECPVCGNHILAKNTVPKHLLLYHSDLPEFESKEKCREYSATTYFKFIMEVDKNRRLKEISTNIERYGVDNANKTEAVKQKMRDTCMEKYGVEYSAQAQEVIDKRTATWMENYGTEFAAQSEEVKASIKESWDANWAGHPLRSQDILDKRVETWLEKYGVECPWAEAMKTPEVKAKMKATCIERYGTDWWHNNLYATEGRCPRIGKNEVKLLNDKELELDITIARQYRVGRYVVDGYDQVNNVVYEVHEKYHTKPKNVEKDKTRTAFIKDILQCEFVIIKDY